METNTIIELFEELKKQIATLGRRIDDHNPPSPSAFSAPTATNEQIARLLETAQHTRTNVERARMELTDRLSTLEKKLEQEHEKIAAEMARTAPPSPQRHIHTIDFKSSKSTFCMIGLSVAVVCSSVHIYRLHDRIDSLRDTELKYRYIQMMGGINESALRELNALFYDSEHAADRRTLRRQVERYETAVREAIESQQRNNTQIQKAEKIKQKFLAPQKGSQK